MNNAFDAGNLQLKGKDRASYWAFSVVFAYQSLLGDPPFGEDGDPDTEVPETGETPETPLTFQPWGYCGIFLESIRDYEFGVRPKEVPAHHLPRTDFSDVGRVEALVKRYWERIDAVLAHEIGHAPGRQAGFNDHKEDGIMIRGAPSSLIGDDFSAKTLLRFRKTESWTRE